MTLPEHLLSSWIAHRDAGRPAVFLVRHAERHPVHDLKDHERVLLTERGHAQARAAGAQLAQHVKELRVHHSPVARCMQTAQGIVDGAAERGVHARVHGALAALGTPFVVDSARAYRFASEYGPRFIREWFDGRAPDGCLLPRAVAARGQIAAVVTAMEHAELLVTHDWNLALVREEFLSISADDAWPKYLDGVVVAEDGDAIVIEAEGRKARVSREKLG